MFDWFFEGAEEVGLLILNGIIAGLGAVIGGMVSLLPEMPALPSMPTPFATAYAWVAWFFPVGTVVDILVAVLAFWIAWQLVVIALRWAKAVSE